jgi:type II secretory pathway component GspD/PulD (secretin)
MNPRQAIPPWLLPLVAAAVLATPAVPADAAQKKEPVKTRVFPLGQASAVKAVGQLRPTLEAAFGDETARTMDVSAQRRTNHVTVRGTRDQLEFVHTVLSGLCPPGRHGQVFALQRGSSAGVAHSLNRLLANRVGRNGTLLITADEARNSVFAEGSYLDLQDVGDFVASRRAVAWASAAVQPDKAKGPKDKKKVQDEPVTQVLALKYTTAAEAARVLKEIYRDKLGTELVLGIDDRSNSLVVKGALDLVVDVAKLLQTLDVAAPAAGAPAAEVFVLPLATADPMLIEEGLRLLFPTQEAGRFVVDRELRILIIYSRPALIAAAKDLIVRLEQTASPAPPVLANIEFQVRVIWLRAAAADDKTALPLPKELEGLELDLGKLGMTRPSVAGQVMVRTGLNQPFEVGGDGALPGWKWQVTGRLGTSPGGATLDLTLSAGDKDGKVKGPVLLRTQVPLNAPEAVLIGAAPTGSFMSAFAVQVTAVVPGAKGPPKKGK